MVDRKYIEQEIDSFGRMENVLDETENTNKEENVFQK